MRVPLRVGVGGGSEKPAETQDLRLTTATTIERDVDIEAAASQLGHSGSRVTREHYIERAAQAPDLRAALDALAPVSGGFRVGQQESAPSA